VDARKGEPMDLCDPINLGHGVVPTVFWGNKFARGGMKFSN